MPFCLVRPPGEELPVVLSSPHSGVHYPRSLLDAVALTQRELRWLEDGPVDRLLLGAVESGAALLAAVYARAFVDLNRASDEFDVDLLETVDTALPMQMSPRAQLGLGVIPSRLATRRIYRDRLPLAEARDRLCRGYRPYHEQLQELLRQRLERFNAVLLLDCHSMPGDRSGDRDGRAPDVVVGDRFGRAAREDLVLASMRFFERGGLSVARNRPYAGGYITEFYGRPHAGQFALQLEFRRSLFMDEQTGRLLPAHSKLKDLIAELVVLLADLMDAAATTSSAA